MSIAQKNMNLKPLSNHVVLKPLEEEKVTKSGLVIPETVSEKPTRAEVIAVGPGKKNEKGEAVPVLVKVGDVVLFKKYGPDEIEIDGIKYLVCEEEDILAVLE